MGLRLPAQTQQADHIRVAELGEHFGFAAEVELELFVSGLQALHQHHRLLLALLDTLGFAQKHLAELPFACVTIYAAQRKGQCCTAGSQCTQVYKYCEGLPKVVMV